MPGKLTEQPLECQYYYETVNKGLPGLKWDVGGDGGNMMATPPLGTNAPFGKLLLGTKRQASKPQWAEQNIQPVALIDTTWLMVGHVDEALMCVAADKILYADPWRAADLLHQQVTSGAGTNTMWFGFDTGAARNHTVQSVAIATNNAGALKQTTLPIPGLSNGTTMATLVFSNVVFAVGDVLRVDDEVLKVYSATGPTTTVTRAEAGRPAAAHFHEKAIVKHPFHGYLIFSSGCAYAIKTPPS